MATQLVYVLLVVRVQFFQCRNLVGTISINGSHLATPYNNYTQALLLSVCNDTDR